MSKKWTIVNLSEILTERRENPLPEDLTSGRIRLVSKINFASGKLELRSESETKTGMILVYPGDLIISGINAAKGAIAIYGSENTDPVAATIHYSAYTINTERTNLRYLWWFFRSKSFQSILETHIPGGIKTELKAKRILPIPIPLPPLEEQRHIVARIEELAGAIAEARRLRQESIEDINKLIQCKLSSITKKIKINGTLFEVLLSKPRNGWSARCDDFNGEIPVLSLSAITGFHYSNTKFKRTSLPVSSNAHYWLKKGDLLITRSNSPELVGHAAIYNGVPFPCIYPDLMMRLDINHEKANTIFIWYWLQSPYVREFIIKHSKGTSPTMKKISQSVVMSIPFPTSLKLSEQLQIVSYLDDLQTKIDALKRLQAETAAELDALLPSILDKAFKGEL